jgi:hypothetical protein
LCSPTLQAKWTIENEIFGDTEITNIPAFAHNRFGMRHELAFKLSVSWVAAMTCVSTVRMNDPQCDANLLLQNTFALRNKVHRSFVIALAVKCGAIAELMRCVWHTDAFCSVHVRDQTVETRQKHLRRISSLQEEDLNGTLTELKALFGGEKAEALQKFWDRGARERGIVFGQAVDPDFKSYVQHFLQAAGDVTADDLGTKKRACPDVRCLDQAPIHNAKTENLFAHQACAAQSTRADHNRLRGLAMAKASGTFTLESKLRSNRRKRFLADAASSKARMEDWVQDHKDDKGFLGLFNKKCVSEQLRTDMMRRALSGRRDNASLSPFLSFSLSPYLPISPLCLSPYLRRCSRARAPFQARHYLFAFPSSQQGRSFYQPARNHRVSGVCRARQPDPGAP